MNDQQRTEVYGAARKQLGLAFKKANIDPRYGRVVISDKPPPEGLVITGK